tara:strand:- start:225 stop:437 length:213 start_codon:yes stop_codon:yes gene_type:complete
MIQAFVVKVFIKQIMKAIEKADDKRIASNHDKRISKLEKDSHPVADFVCTECGSKAKRVKGKLKKIKERF